MSHTSDRDAEARGRPQRGCAPAPVGQRRGGPAEAADPQATVPPRIEGMAAPSGEGPGAAAEGKGKGREGEAELENSSCGTVRYDMNDIQFKTLSE